MTGARRLARFVAGLRLDAIPARVVDRTVLLTLDTLGNALAAAGEDFGRAALDTAERLGGVAESALLGRAARASTVRTLMAATSEVANF